MSPKIPRKKKRTATPEQATHIDAASPSRTSHEVGKFYDEAPQSSQTRRSKHVPESHHVGVEFLPEQSLRARLRLRCGRIRQRLNWKRVTLIIVALVLLVFAAFAAYAYYIATHSITDKENQTGFFGQVRHVLQPKSDPVRGEENDRVNILLLGKGGDGHAGGQLVDTVMVASIKPSTNEVALISLPRDLVIPHATLPNGKGIEYRKLNTMVTLGGIDFARQTMKTVLGLDVQYYAEVDFGGFRNIVDTIGGVNIAVPNGFTGYYGANELSQPCPRADKHTLDDGVYCAITFTAGEEQMNGERALQYSRIRKMAPGSENPDEGTDFKRAARQQLVLQAIKDKVMSASTILNPVRITGLMNDLGDHVSTDMEVWEMLRFAELVKDVDRTKIKNVVIDQGPDGLVRRDPGSEAYILVPNAGLTNYSEIHHVAVNVFDDSAVASAQTKQLLAAEHSVVIVQNGTSTAGLAARASTVLGTAGVSVTSYTNAASKDVAQTFLIDFSGGQKPDTQKALEQQFGVQAQPAVFSAELTPQAGGASNEDLAKISREELPQNVDFVVVVGLNDVATFSTINTNSNTNAVNTNSPTSATNTNTPSGVTVTSTKKNTNTQNETSR